jgi:hypothetical protein
LNVLNQILAYDNDINVMSENINTVKKSAKWAGHVASMVEMINTYIVLSETEKEGPFRSCRRR